MSQQHPEQSALGKRSSYESHYNPDLLFPIPRQEKRNEIGVPSSLPFHGYDLWNHYEVSWLNPKGKPVVALAQLHYGCDTPCIIESKSMKLYFNSLNNSSFKDKDTLQAVIEKDMRERVGGPVHIALLPLQHEPHAPLVSFTGTCLDALDTTCTHYLVEPNLLRVETTDVNETLYSHLLKSNCLVTNQPDWGSVQISYTGKQINHESLLQYLVSFRNHNEFHEQCIERIFMDILRQCQPKTLTVYGRYTRRGGLDINPYRSTEPYTTVLNPRLDRQ